MHESVLRDFFQGRTSGKTLAEDLRDSIEKLSEIASYVKIKDMDQNFALTRAMLVSLCDEVSRGTLAPEMLRPIGFALIASDKFDFPDDDDDVFREVVHDWSCPEVNYPLTLENVRRFRKWLLNEEPRPKKGEPREGGKIVSILEKKQIT